MRDDYYRFIPKEMVGEIQNRKTGLDCQHERNHGYIMVRKS